MKPIRMAMPMEMTTQIEAILRQPEDEHSEVAQKADDERVDDLADHEAVEDLVRLAAKVEQMVRMLYGFAELVVIS